MHQGPPLDREYAQPSSLPNANEQYRRKLFTIYLFIYYLFFTSVAVEEIDANLFEEC
jgi:hypothetical protein